MLNTILSVAPVAVSLSDNSNASIWRYGLTRNGVAPEEVKPPLYLTWKRTLGGPGTFGYFTSSPIGADELIYVGAGDGIYALDYRNGSIRWSYKTERGVKSSPSIDSGILYVGSDDKRLYALDARSGAKVWDFKAQEPITSSPLIVGGKVYVGSEDNTLYALDSKTGSLKWKFQAKLQVTPSPAYAYDTIYVGSWDGYVYALDPENGGLRWKFYTEHGIESSPAIVEGVLYIGASYTNRIMAIDAFTGRKLWEYSTGYKVISSPAVGGSQVFVGSTDTYVYSLDAQTGTVLWKYNVSGGISGSSPTVSGDTVYIGAEDKRLYAFEKSTGRIVWSFEADATLHSAPLAYKGMLFTSSSANTVYAFLSLDSQPSGSPASQPEKEAPMSNDRARQVDEESRSESDDGGTISGAFPGNLFGGTFLVVAGAAILSLLFLRRRKKA